MPTYQYACTECGHAFEQFQSFSDDALTECPECQGKLRKVFNAVGVVFKGSGFYRTDSRSGSSASDIPAAKSESKSEGKGAGATPAKSDSTSKSESGSGSASKPAATSSTSSD